MTDFKVNYEDIEESKYQSWIIKQIGKYTICFKKKKNSHRN